MRLWQAIDAVQQRQRGHLMPWTPVMLGLGVAVYFAMSVEPGPGVFATAAILALVTGLAGLRWRAAAGPGATVIVLVCAGLLVSGARAHLVAGPVLGFRYYGPIEGRIVAIDRSASDKVRLTLDRVVLARTDPARVPLRVRVSLHGDQDYLDPVPGARVMMTGHLSPPEGPAEPGGFDFQRHAWFLRIGAVGYTRTPALLLEPRAEGALPLTHLRLRLSAEIRARIPGDAGAFASAVLTGDRSAMGQGQLEDLRRSNIAHLLAISGLHMGLLTGFVFTALRAAMALFPWLALRVPIRKWAACGALLAGAFYLALSGGNVATERAFVQVAVMFTAVLLDRRAITLRSVAIAALIVLVHRPEALFGPGFQMSFAATTALVAVFNGLRRVAFMTNLPRWARAAAALVISSAVAGAATAPFSAAHFNQIAAYGLIANLLSVPVMGTLVIPAAVIAGCLWPLGLERVALAAMELGLNWILEVAARVSALPGAVQPVVMPPGAVLVLITLGALLVILWQGRARLAGVLPVLLALWLWTGAERPGLLISSTGRLAGVESDAGRALSRPRGDGFVAGLWLENDGDGAEQEDAAARPGWSTDGAARVTTYGGHAIWHGVGRRTIPDLAGACARFDLLITPERLAEVAPDLQRLAWAPAPPAGPMAARAETAPDCQIISAETLRRTGALALSVDDGTLRIITARQVQGTRLWSARQ